MISFNQIPANLRVPFTYIEFDSSKAVQGPSLKVYKGLLLGQKLAAGTATADIPVRVSSNAQAKTLFGAGSMLYGMVKAWLDNNSTTELWVIPQSDNGAGVAATKVLTFAGPASGAGTLNAYIAGKLYQVGVASGDTATVIAAALAAAITADADSIYTAAAAAAVLTLTYKHKGLIGNELDVRFNYFQGEVFPAGVSCVVTDGVAGTANPSLTAAISAMAEVQYDVIGFPYTDAGSFTAMEAELDSRFGPLRQNDGMAFAAKNADLSALSVLGNSRNSKHVTIMEAYLEPTPVYEKAASYAAVSAFYLNIDPARPIQTLPMVGILPAAQADRFIMTERNSLLFNGISTSYTGDDGVVRIERGITTYKTNAVGANDVSYLNVETLKTLSYLRYDFRNYILTKYPRHKLADDGVRVAPGQAIMTPKLGKAEAIAKYKEWQDDLGIVENFDAFKAGLIVERDVTNRDRLNWYLPPDLMNQLRVNGIQIGFIL